MVIVHPDHIVGLDNTGDGVGEMAVHAQIAAHFDGVEFGKVHAVMQHRPEHAIGEAVIIFLIVIGRKIQQQEAAVLAFYERRPAAAMSPSLT
jgi:hypothetical protein